MKSEKSNKDYSISNLKILQNELSRCLQIKKLKLGKYVDELRDEIKKYWSEYLYTKHDKQLFEKYLSQEIVDDELYEIHKNYLKELLQYGEKHKELISCLNNWNQVWAKYVQFEVLKPS